MHADLRKNWASLKASGVKRRKKVITSEKGRSVEELLKEDLDDGVHRTAILSFFTMIFIINAVATVLTYWIGRPAAENLIKVLASLQFCSCFLFCFPLSRFLLPENVKNCILAPVMAGASAYETASKSGFVNIRLLQIMFTIPSIFNSLLENLIIRPFYLILAVLFGKKVLGRVAEEKIFYANVEESYINSLLNKPPAHLTPSEQNTVVHMFNELLCA